jgi:hypothetical protein
MTATGKWTHLGVPHKGWTCVDIEDLSSPDHVCEMCETQDARYVHTMEHPDYADALRVGCVCAGHMEEDLLGARKREDAFKASRSRRARWLTREWRTSRAGNEYLNTDGEHAKLAAFDAMIAAKARDARCVPQIDEIRRRLVAPAAPLR